MKRRRIEKELKRREKKFWVETQRRIATLKFMGRKLNEVRNTTDTGIDVDKDN